jgi:Flp pilus assembly protein TadG
MEAPGSAGGRRRALRRSTGRAGGFHRARRCRGAAAVEFAIVAPIFFVLVIAAFEFGRLNVIRHTADNAAYEAARHAMVPGATAVEAVDKAGSILRIVGTRGAKISINPPLLGPEVDQVTVTVDVPLAQNGWIAPRFTRNTTIRATSTLRTERARD